MNRYASVAARTALTALSVTLSTLAALGLHVVGVADAGIVLTLLMAVVLCSWAFGLPYSVLSSVLAILVHSYFFSVPIYSFEVYNPQHLIAFCFLVLVGLIVGTLSGRLREQVNSLAIRESRLQSLHRLGQALAGTIDRADVVEAAEPLLSELLEGTVRIVDASAPLATGTRVFALTGSLRTLGWLTVDPGSGPDPFLPERRVWVETLLAPVTQALDRVDLVRERQEQLQDLENTRTRNTILHGISHDLRTPLTVISATAGSLLERTLPQDNRRADLESLAHESQAVVRQVEDLLELTSLTSGSVTPRLAWVPIEDLVYPCAEAILLRYPGAQVSTSLPEQELCQVDETLVMKALTNLLENAAVYAPGPVEIEVSRPDGTIRLAVADRGPGVPDAEKGAIFGQFVRGGAGRRTAGHRGSGLGLALVQTVAGLHGGIAGVADRPGGGAVFWFELNQPLQAPPLWGGAP